MGGIFGIFAKISKGNWDIRGVFKGHGIFIHPPQKRSRLCLFKMRSQLISTSNIRAFEMRQVKSKTKHIMKSVVKTDLLLFLSWPALSFITKTSLCNVYPLKPHFYIAKLGYVGVYLFAGVYLFFLFLLQNIDYGYSLEPPRRGGSNMYPQSMF